MSTGGGHAVELSGPHIVRSVAAPTINATLDLDLSDGWSSSRLQTLKRAFDLVVASILLVTLVPLLLLLAVAVAIDSGFPVFFVQERLGRRGQAFRMIKFRTMARDAEDALETLLRDQPALEHEWQSSQKLRSDPRVSRLGRWLRIASLDELPQLINVLKGDMSLVGPRPATGDPADVFGGYLAAIQVPKPGITGLWAVSGRQDCEDDRAELEYQYVREWNLMRDLAILARTPRAVLSGRGAY